MVHLIWKSLCYHRHIKVKKWVWMIKQGNSVDNDSIHKEDYEKRGKLEILLNPYACPHFH